MGIDYPVVDVLLKRSDSCNRDTFSPSTMLIPEIIRSINLVNVRSEEWNKSLNAGRAGMQSVTQAIKLNSPLNWYDFTVSIPGNKTYIG